MEVSFWTGRGNSVLRAALIAGLVTQAAVGVAWAQEGSSGSCPEPCLIASISTTNSSGHSRVVDMELTSDGHALYAAVLGRDLKIDVSAPQSPMKEEIILTPNLDGDLDYAIKVTSDKYYKVGSYFLGIMDLASQAVYEIDFVTLGLPQGIHPDLDLVNNTAYMVRKNNAGPAAGQTGSLHIADVANPQAPSALGATNWSDYPSGPPTHFPNTVIVQDNYAYVGTEGLRVFNISNPSAITQVGRFSDVWIPNQSVHPQEDLEKVGFKIYKAQRAAGLLVINVQFPAHPVLQGLIGHPTLAIGDLIAFEVVGNKALVATGVDKKFKVLDISDPTHPIVLKTRNIAGVFDNAPGTDALEVEVDPACGLAYVGGETSLRVYDVHELLGVNPCPVY